MLNLLREQIPVLLFLHVTAWLWNSLSCLVCSHKDQKYIHMWGRKERFLCEEVLIFGGYKSFTIGHRYFEGEACLLKVGHGCMQTLMRTDQKNIGIMKHML
jgi:hypothetical protein